MTAHVFSATTIGFDGELIDVECDTSNSLPGLVIVGLGNKSIDEARERVRSAIKNSRLNFPRKRITINLAPANLPKVGSHFDLPIAMAILVVSSQLPQPALNDTLFVGELALDGKLRPVRGVVAYAQMAKAAGLRRIILPRSNCLQASLVPGIEVIGVDTLTSACNFLKGQVNLTPWPTLQPQRDTPTHNVTLEHIYGQEQAKRALTIAAAGHHNILLTGPPGAGKTMLAKALPSILPPLSNQEIVEVTKLHSLVNAQTHVITSRPFRAPHHSASHIALVGGGQLALPGEISLAHRGVLFLDELPEYSRQSLESLRQPLEDKTITITRTHQRATYPADFMLVATQNPCPCGYAGHPTKTCICLPSHIMRYQQKISGPLLDRIDLVARVSSVEHGQLLGAQTVDNTTTNYADAVLAARQGQIRRFKGATYTNANLTSTAITQTANLHHEAKDLLNTAAGKLSLSTRSYFKIIKVARTIADLESSEGILPTHIAEALQYRFD